VRTANAPPLAMVAALCQRHGWDMALHNDAHGPTITVAPSQRPVLGYVSEGPLTLLWYGATEAAGRGARGRGTRPTSKDTAYVLAVVPDPNSHVLTLSSASFRGQALAISSATGSVTRALLSRHPPGARGVGHAGLWTAKPRKPVRAAQACVGVTVRYAAPTLVEHTLLKWEEGARGRAVASAASTVSAPKAKAAEVEAPDGTLRGRVEVSVQQIKTGQGASPGSARSAEAREYIAVLHFRHRAAGAAASFSHAVDPGRSPPPNGTGTGTGTGRRPTSRRHRKGGARRIPRADVASVVTPIEAQVITAKGRRMPASMTVTEQGQGPDRVYRAVVAYRTGEVGLQPERLRVSWATGYRHVEEGLVLDGAPMR
jgi:hypothetical protein